MSDIAIIVENLTKSYKLYNSPLDRLKELVHPYRKKYHHDFYALKDVTFEIKKGETVGIIGKNGSGKSTLLKLLTGVAAPSSGSVTVNGKVSALLELGAGFNPELSGLDNVYFNGMITGFTRKEMDRKMDDILTFADIGEYVYQPVKTYSSGMFVRLAFAVATMVEPDILIVDEALAVGDVKFQYKCIERITDMISKGVNVILVTHDISVVKKLCTSACWLHEGKIALFNDAISVSDTYLDFMRLDCVSNNSIINSLGRKDIVAQADLPMLFSVQMFNNKDKVAFTFVCGEKMSIKIIYMVNEINEDEFVIGAAIFRNDGLYVCGLNTKIDNIKIKQNIGKNEIYLEYPSLNLMAGTYFIDVGIFHYSATVALDYKKQAVNFSITSPYIGEGIVLLEHKWQTSSK